MELFTYKDDVNNQSSSLNGFFLPAYTSEIGTLTTNNSVTIVNSSFDESPNQPRMVRPLYIIIACLCGLTILLASFNYGLRRYQRSKKRRGHVDGEVERGRGLKTYRVNDEQDYQRHYKGLFVFGMRNQQE